MRETFLIERAQRNYQVCAATKGVLTPRVGACAPRPHPQPQLQLQFRRSFSAVPPFRRPHIACYRVRDKVTSDDLSFASSFLNPSALFACLSIVFPAPSEPYPHIFIAHHTAHPQRQEQRRGSGRGRFRKLIDRLDSLDSTRSLPIHRVDPAFAEPDGEHN